MTNFTEPLLETPQTVAVVPQFVLNDEANTYAARCAAECSGHQHGGG